MRPNRWADKLVLRAWRKRIEALYSQLEALGVQRLRARTNPGLELKLHAALSWLEMHPSASRGALIPMMQATQDRHRAYRALAVLGLRR